MELEASLIISELVLMLPR
nr:hypothetical protein [Tanacetum cinerariifolium]